MLAVDGVDVVSGSTAAVGQTGYVLDAGSTFDIAGWRKNDREIAAFAFAVLADSYAARTGWPGRVGAVGMAAFLEKPSPRPAACVSTGAKRIGHRCNSSDASHGAA